MRRQSIPIRIKPVNLLDHKGLLCFRQAITRRKRNSPLVNSLADTEIMIDIPDIFAIRVARLPVKRIKESARLNVLLLQESRKPFGVVAKEGSKPEYRLAPRINLRRLKALDPLQLLHVAIVNLALFSYDRRHFLHLRNPDGRL